MAVEENEDQSSRLSALEEGLVEARSRIEDLEAQL